ncbi:apolipoprotein D-like [Microplitis demolitor]|uniref:apolipoprotein D-like n=1 Tax=Microplitis demolitor TaxID=69319 RepID=UPI0004CDB22A|nr:apolipoprotein D-like [Microplitis demolitor]
MLSATIFFGLIAGSFGYLTLLDGNCPKVNPRQQLDPYKITGNWWLVERNVENTDQKGTCQKLHWDSPVNGEVRCVTSRNSMTTNLTTIVEAQATINEDNIVKFRNEVPVQGEFDENQWVLAIDYDSYSIVWSCTNIGTMRIEKAFVFTRNRELMDPNFVAAVFNSYGLDYPNFTVIDNENCDPNFIY